MKRSVIHDNILGEFLSRPHRKTLPLDLEEKLCLGITCMNCHSTIPSENIDDHSMSCLVPLNLGEEGSLEFCSKRIDKFTSFILALSTSPELKAADVKIIKELESILEEVTRMKASSNEIQVIRNYLEHLDYSYIPSTSIRICLERGHALIKDYLNVVEPTSATSKDIIDHLKSKVRAIRSNSRCLHSTDQELIHLDKNEIEEINSELLSRKSVPTQNISFSTVNENVEESPSIEFGIECNQRKFYAMCINVKMNLDPHNPAQTVTVKSIHEEAIRKNIPEDDWLEFIKSFLDQKSIKQTRNSIKSIRRSSLFDEALDY